MLLNPEVKRLYARFPALIRSARWPELESLVNGGQFDKAVELSKEISARNKQFNAQNIMARKIRIERVGLFKAQIAYRKRLTDLFRSMADEVEGKVISWGDTRRRQLTAWLRSQVTRLRSDLRVLITDAIWESVKLGVKHTVDAVGPVLKDNQEA